MMYERIDQIVLN